MSYRCNSCLYIFINKKSNCPYCGGRIYLNNTTDAELLNEGFSYEPNMSITTSSGTDLDNQTLDSTYENDYYAKLQADFRNEYLTSTKNKDGVSISNNMPAPSTTQFSNSSTGKKSEQPFQQSESPISGGFFSQFNSTSASSSTPIVPVVEKPSENSQPIVNNFDDEKYNLEMQRLKEQQRRLQREYKRIAFSNFLHNIPWRTVFRILCTISVIIFVIFVWQMRYVILQSIMNFIVSLIPIAIIIGIFWYIIKRLFK